MRLDQYVVSKLSVSRSAAVQLINDGKVKVNSKSLKPSYTLRANDNVVIDYSPDEAIAVAELEVEVLYEDHDCAVINKPVGVLTHSKGALNPEATIASWLSQHAPAMTGERAGIVHRLDRATSGVMIVAKTSEALSWLQKQFAQRRVKKTYVAVVKGNPKESKAIIDMPIGRNPKNPQTFRVGSNGKPAVTAYKVMDYNDRVSLLELKPVTGRTHQLRVHLAYLNHPIVGDSFYGGPAAERLYLHAQSLELTLPNKLRKTFAVPAPPEFAELMQ